MGCALRFKGFALLLAFAQGWAPWAAVTAGPYGSCTDVNYGRAVAHNSTHLHYQQVSVTSRGVIDELWIVSEQHGSFRNRTNN